MRIYNVKPNFQDDSPRWTFRTGKRILHCLIVFLFVSVIIYGAAYSLSLLVGHIILTDSALLKTISALFSRLSTRYLVIYPIDLLRLVLLDLNKNHDNRMWMCCKWIMI